MKHHVLKNFRRMVVVVMAAITGLAFTSCEDEIDKSNRFTFKGDLISTYLQKNEAKFSKFTQILSKAKLGKKETAGSILKTLSTYGSYTCFAPTNEAIDSFLLAQYEKYELWESTNGEEGENTGITSPDFEFLEDSMATVIAMNHIIEKGYKVMDVNEGSFPGNTMSGRSIEIAPDKEKNMLRLNNSAYIITQDVELENGYLQVIDGVLNPSNKLLPDLIAQHQSFSLFYEAVKLTKLDDLLNIYEIDPNYDGTREFSMKMFSAQDSKTPYPKFNRQCYTVLIEPNELYHSQGIYTIYDIIELANKWYTKTTTGAPLTDEIRNDYTHRDNPLNQFVAYHIIDRQLKYSSSTSPGGFIMENYDNLGFKSSVNLNQNFDSYEYYETMLPYTMVKVTKPYTNPDKKDQIIINYSQDMGNTVMNPEMSDHINVTVEKFNDAIEKYEGLSDFVQNARNGYIHTIDKILIYNEDEMAGNVLNERMRMDLSAIFPELTNNDVRWDLLTSETLVTYIPDGFCKGLKLNSSDTRFWYHRPYPTGRASYANYQGDEVIVEGLYDFEYRMPYVPAGAYEIRFGYPRGYNRGVCQFYFDGKICGIPVDLRLYTPSENEDDPNHVAIGWFPDKKDGVKRSEDEIKELDKAMRNKEYMKGPASITLESNGNVTMRDSPQAVRKIIGTFQIQKGKSYWLRFKNATDGGDGNQQFDQDYLEIVPTSVISNPLKPEDRY